MTLTAPLARRLALGLCGLGGLGVAARRARRSPARAGSPAAAARVPGPLHRRRHRSPPTSPPVTARRRRIPRPGALAAGRWRRGGSCTRTSSGTSNSWSRTASSRNRSGRRSRYGAWSLDAAARTGGTAEPGDSGRPASSTLRQRGMPFDGGWQADNALGDLNSPDISLARLQPRFYLPTGPMQGLTTEWRGPSGLQLVAGGGVPGALRRHRGAGFSDTSDGSTATAGAQWSPAANWTVGGQLIEAHDVNLDRRPALSTSARGSRPTTGLLSARLAGRRQARAIEPARRRQSAATANGLGAWVDGSIDRRAGSAQRRPLPHRPELDLGQPADLERRRRAATTGSTTRAASGSRMSASTRCARCPASARHHLSHRRHALPDVARLGHRRRRATSAARRRQQLVARGLRRSREPPGAPGRAQADFAETPTGKGTTLTLDQTWSTPDAASASAPRSRLERITRRPAQRHRPGQHRARSRGVRRRPVHRPIRASRATCAGRPRCRATRHPAYRPMSR